jgi:methyl-accepting chemotaxis protein
MVPKSSLISALAAQESSEIMRDAIKSHHVSKASLLSTGQYTEYTRQTIPTLSRYFDVTRVNHQAMLNPPKFQVPYEGTIEEDLNHLVQRFIQQDRQWILFSVVDLNGYVVACADADRPALTGDPQLDDRNRFKRLLPHPSWVRGGRGGLGDAVEWLPNNLRREDFRAHGVSLSRPSTPDQPMVQTYIRNNVTVMTLLSYPLYLDEERFGSIMIAWQ